MFFTCYMNNTQQFPFLGFIIADLIIFFVPALGVIYIFIIFQHTFVTFIFKNIFCFFMNNIYSWNMSQCSSFFMYRLHFRLFME